MKLKKPLAISFCLPNNRCEWFSFDDYSPPPRWVFRGIFQHITETSNDRLHMQQRFRPKNPARRH
jgi:hypothetical protein